MCQTAPNFRLGGLATMRQFVSASELARFSYCEMQWAIERRFQFDAMTDRQLARMARRGERSRDAHTRALGLAAAAYRERIRPALRSGERYHTADARSRVPRTHRLAVVFAILAAMALLAIAVR